MWCSLQGEVSATNDTGTVETEDIAGLHARHAEGQADLVSLLDEVGEAVDVDGDVVSRLSGEEGEKVLDRVGNWGRRGFRVALLQGPRSGLVRRRVRRIVDMSLRSSLDDGRSRGKPAGLNWREERGGKTRAGSSKLQQGAEKRPAHFSTAVPLGRGHFLLVRF